MPALPQIEIPNLVQAGRPAPLHNRWFLALEERRMHQCYPRQKVAILTILHNAFFRGTQKLSAGRQTCDAP